MAAGKQDFVIEQGKTFSRVLRWSAPPYVYRPITGIAQSAPARITCPDHGAPDGWRVAVVSVRGMKQINAANTPPKATDYHKATVVDANTVELNEVNAADFSAYASGGYLMYLTPVDLGGFTARMTIKSKIGGTVLETLTTENGKIVLDNVKKTIILKLDAAATAAYAWTKGVYELELVSAGGDVTALLTGAVSVAKEVTT